MSAIFLKLLNLSISASYLVLAVLALRFVFKRAPKWVNVLLWGLVALRLVLPFSIESSLSLIPSSETLAPEVVQFDPAPTITSGVRIIDNAVNPSFSESFAADPATSVTPLFVWTEIAGIIWLAGLIAMLGYALVSYLRLRRRVGASLLLQENIYLCDEISSPFILGIVKPRIYLPSAMDEVQRQNVLAHERAHLARHDHWWKPLGFALLAVYWFNPLLWIAYSLLCRDIELACDEKVIRGMDADEVKTYSSVLLACSVPRKMIAACPLAFGEVGVKARVKSVLNYRRPAFWVIVLALAASVAVAVCFLTNPQRESLKWAKNLRVEDVESIELVVLPQAADKQYRLLSENDISKAVDLVNASRGRYIRTPESLSGSTTNLFITTSDGARHLVSNSGNVYLQIDGDSYKSDYAWLSSWPYLEGDSPLPENFDFDFTYPENTAMASLAYPLSEDSIGIVLQGMKLNWTLTDSSVQDSSFHYTLNRPDEGSDASVSIDGTFDQDQARELTVSYMLPYDGSNTLTDPTWADFRPALELAVRLYGGFTDAQALYRACARTELSQAEPIVFSGALTGGYAVVRVSPALWLWTPSSLRTISVTLFESEEAYLVQSQDLVSNRVFMDGWSICVPDGWEQAAGSSEWRSTAGTGTYLRVEKCESLDNELTGLVNAGFTAESFPAPYRFVTQAGLSNTVIYLYPIPDSGACYLVETHWSFDGTDEAQVSLERPRVSAMAQSFALTEDANGALGSADLDGDGMEERFFCAVSSPGAVYRVYLVRDDGTELWSAELALAHAGWSSYFLYSGPAGEAAILRYTPYMSQGLADYSYALFTPDELIRESSVSFSINPDSADPWPPKAQAFADEINALLERSTLLISTLDGELHLAGDPDFFPRCEIPPEALSVRTESQGLTRTLYAPVSENSDFQVTLAVSYQLAERENGGYRIAEITGAQALTAPATRRGWVNIKKQVDIPAVSISDDGESAQVSLRYYASTGSGSNPYTAIVRIDAPDDTAADTACQHRPGSVISSAWKRSEKFSADKYCYYNVKWDCWKCADCGTPYWIETTEEEFCTHREKDGVCIRCGYTGLTGYSAYDALIALVKQTTAESYTGSEDFSFELLASGYQTPGWTLLDLDGDGMSELLLGADWAENGSVIYNIYTQQNGRAVQLIDGHARSRYRLCTDGSLCREWSASSSVYGFTYYRYAAGALSLTEALVHDPDTSGNANAPWFYSQSSTSFLLNNKINPAFAPIRSGRAANIQEKYSYQSISFTPFGEKPV